MNMQNAYHASIIIPKNYVYERIILHNKPSLFRVDLIHSSFPPFISGGSPVSFSTVIPRIFWRESTLQLNKNGADYSAPLLQTTVG